MCMCMCACMCQVTLYAFPEYCWGITLPILAAGYGAMHMHMQRTWNAHAAMHMLPCTCCHASCVRPLLSLHALHRQAGHASRPDPGDVTRSTFTLPKPFSSHLSPYTPPHHRYSTYHPCILLDYLPGTFLAQPLFDLSVVAGQARFTCTVTMYICVPRLLCLIMLAPHCQATVVLAFVRTCLGGDLLSMLHVGLAAWPKCVRVRVRV